MPKSLMTTVWQIKGAKVRKKSYNHITTILRKTIIITTTNVNWGLIRRHALS